MTSHIIFFIKKTDFVIVPSQYLKLQGTLIAYVCMQLLRMHVLYHACICGMGYRVAVPGYWEMAGGGVGAW